MGIIKRARVSVAAKLLNVARKPYSSQLSKYNLNAIKAKKSREAAMRGYASQRMTARAFADLEGLEHFESATDAATHLSRIRSSADSHFDRANRYEEQARPYLKGAKKARAIRRVGRKVARVIAGKPLKK